MLNTPLRDLLGIDVPVIQAGMSVFTSPRLVAAVSNAGGLGSLGAWQRTPEDLRRDLAALRETTDRPFAVNHVVPDLDPVCFEITLEAAPALVSFALDDAGALMDRVHEAGSLVMQQVTTEEQARVAAGHGADIIVAQGTEAGGYGGSVAALALVPQVVGAVAPVPVVAAGGIADGRGLAAALLLGAAGVNLGTRFLASREAPVSEAWKRAIVASSSEAWIQLEAYNDVVPDPGTIGYGTKLRARRTAFTEGLQERVAEVRADPSAARKELADAEAEDRWEELLIVGGQSAGLIDSILPAGDIVRTIARQAEDVLAGAAGLIG